MKNQTVGDLMRTLVKRYNLAPERESRQVAVRTREDGKVAVPVDRQSSSALQDKMESLVRENHLLKASLKGKEGALEKKVEECAQL